MIHAGFFEFKHTQRIETESREQSSTLLLRPYFLGAKTHR